MDKVASLEYLYVILVTILNLTGMLYNQHVTKLPFAPGGM